jgi:hypothetical protein
MPAALPEPDHSHLHHDQLNSLLSSAVPVTSHARPKHGHRASLEFSNSPNMSPPPTANHRPITIINRYDNRSDHDKEQERREPAKVSLREGKNFPLIRYTSPALVCPSYKLLPSFFYVDCYVSCMILLINSGHLSTQFETDS